MEELLESLKMLEQRLQDLLSGLEQMSDGLVEMEKELRALEDLTSGRREE